MKTKEQFSIDHITKEEWDRLFSLIPSISRTKLFGKAKGGEKIGKNTYSMPYIEQSIIVQKFVKIAYEIKLIQDFDWPNWKEGTILLQNKESDFTKLDALTLCKLITMIIRVDRYNEGFLVRCFKEGLIEKILSALKQKILVI